MAKIVGGLVLLVALFFGYFLQKSNWDFTLAKAMMGYEFDKMLGKADGIVPTPTTVPETTEPAADTPVAPSAPAHSKDSIYEGKNNSFSDMKRTGEETRYAKAP